MTIEHIKPSDSEAYDDYTPVVAVTGGKTLYVAGHGAFDAQGQLVEPGDHEAQTRQAFRNLVDSLAAAGAGPENIVFSTVYVVGLNDDSYGAFMRGMRSAIDGKRIPPNASTLVGVERLAYEGMLIEINAIAAV